MQPAIPETGKRTEIDIGLLSLLSEIKLDKIGEDAKNGYIELKKSRKQNPRFHRTLLRFFPDNFYREKISRRKGVLLRETDKATLCCCDTYYEKLHFIEETGILDDGEKTEYRALMVKSADSLEREIVLKNIQ